MWTGISLSIPTNARFELPCSKAMTRCHDVAIIFRERQPAVGGEKPPACEVENRSSMPPIIVRL